MNRKSHEGVRRRVGRGLISRLISIRMKYALSFFLLTLSGENWAQLRVNNCSFGGPNGEWISTSIFYPFMDGPGTYTSNRGPIEHLEERSVFEITGTGPGNHYIIDASIYQRSFHSGVLTLLARGDNWGGQNAGLILKGVSSNGYRGATIIKGGFIACNKPVDVVAIQGDIKLVTTTSGLEAGLWFGANGQLSGDGVLIFETSNANAIVSLNGTTQRLWGINAGGVNAIFENIEPENPTNISGIPQNRRKATLILTGTTGRYTIGKDAAFRAGGPAGYNEGLDVLVRGTSQVIQDPAANINNVNFIGQPGGSLELNTSTAQVFTTDASIGFTGTGRIVKTGPGELQAHKFRSGGDVQVRAGNLILKGTSRLGDGLPYMGIASIASGTILDHNNNETTDFRGDITGAGLLRCTGSGTVLISGNKKTFTGNVLVTGSEFFGGNGDISNAVFNLTAGGKMGGGEGQDARGGNLIVGNLTLESKTSVLVVTSMSATDNTPSLVEAKVRGTGDPGSVTIREGNFTIDLVATRLVSGYVLKCTNGRNNPQPPFPTLRTNNTGKRPYFRWDDQGLYMAIGGGLICDNCTFRISGISMTGTIAKPGVILGAPGTYGDMIILNGNGPCNFTVMGTGNYTLSGPIRGTGPVTYRAPDIGSASTTAGITLRGVNSNVYEGVTTIDGGYIICSKRNAVAIPNGIRASAPSGVQTEIWCQSDNQFGTGTVIDFRDAQSYSYLHLNGTTQTVAGLKANNGIAVVQSNESGYFPVGMTDEQLSSSPAVLNIAAAANNTCTFGGGAYIRKGGGKSLSFTVNVTGGTQVIQDPTGNINNVTLASAQGATLEFNSSTGNTYLFGTGVTFQGAGLIKKTGEGAIGTNNSTVLKTEQGQILVSDGVFRNDMMANVYSGNTAILQVDAPNGSNHNPTFDLWGNNSVFGGLRGGGWVQNNWGVSGSPQGGYNDLTLGENSLQNYSVFEGILRDNSTNGPVSGGDFGTGGIALRKVGTGTQVLKGDNRYTGSTTVSSGTLQLQGNGQLGNATTAGTYNGAIEISNATGTQAIFEHKGDKTQVFNGNITSTGSGSSGLFLQSGIGKTIINGTSVKDFTGDINITSGFLGGSGNLSKAGNLYVGASGSIGGGYGVDDNGATLTIAGLNFLAPASKLIVASASATDATPSLLDVRNGSGQATINAANRFTVDLVADNLKSGYLIKCTNGVSGGFLLPTLGRNNTGKKPTFRWDDQGLYMGLGEGLTCDNCTFMSGTTTVTGTIENPAVILSSPGTFTGDITLNGNGPCNFTIMGTGNYTLSGVISGSGPLIYNAPNAGQEGHSAGITLDGGAVANTYTGLTTLASGYIICNKNDGVAAVPGDMKLSATTTTTKSHLWCRTNNQLGNGATVIDFSDAQSYSYFNLNGTTQTIAGLKANNGIAVVQSNVSGYFPVGMTDEQLSSSPAVLNIAAANNTCTFGGGAYIRKGGGKSSSLTVNVTSGSQIIQDPNANINNVTFVTFVNTQGEAATLEFKSSDGNTHTIGSNVTFGGAGILKKTGTALITTNTSNIFKTGGKIWVTKGMFRNENYGNKYANGDSTQIDLATLQVEANAAFDIWANASIFDGLTGGGTIQNNWGPASDVNVPSGGGYCWLILGQNNSQGSPVFFDGIIKDNSGNGPVSANGPGAGGIALKKVGTGTQVLTGGNLYTGRTRVSSGTLKLEGNGVLGATTTGGIYGGILEISNASGTAAVFEHKGDKIQIFTGNITTTGTGGVLGTFLQSGSGQTIIEGAKSFAGNVRITAGFLGGSGDLSKANRVTVEEGGSIGGGSGETTGGDTFIVSKLTLAAASRLRVTSRTDNTPSLVDVRTMETSTTGSGSVIVGYGVKVDVLGGTKLVSGYIMYCTGGTNLPVPTLGENNTRKSVCFKWDATGLYMTLGSIVVFDQPDNIIANSGQAQEAIAFTTTGTGTTAPTGYQWKGVGDLVGLADHTSDWTQMAIPAFTVVTTPTILNRIIIVTAINSTTGCADVKIFTYTVSAMVGLLCDNCSFTRPDNTFVTGTIDDPAVILASPGTFMGDITLNGNGPCNFTIMGTGNYTLSGVISGSGPLIYNAPNAGQEGHSAGITLEGANANTYSGQTTLASGYVICNKTNGVAVPALPGTTIKIEAAPAINAHLWCQRDNQLGAGANIDFRGTQSKSALHLNGTTQTIAGLKANNSHAVVENKEDNTTLLAGTAAQLSANPATLNIAAAPDNICTFGGGGYISKGSSGSPAFTVNVTGGTQVIQDPTGNINNVTLASAQGATLEFNSSTGNTYLLGTGVTFQGAGLIKKTGEGAIGTNNSTVLKTEPGQILVADGVFRNDMTANVYSGNTAILQMDAPNGSNHNPTFDLWGNNSVFGGLRGGGWVQNNWGVSGSPQGGYNDLTLGENSLQNYSVFEGIIRDNSTNGPVSANNFGTGGIALRKVGSGIQVLKGDNRYTGSTTVSSGTLQLQGNGRLGNATTAGIYDGALEISNSAGTQAIFEHNGDKTQVFNGNISNTGTGTLGTYLQSGSGQTIINGAKSFAGNVTITGGFLGGSGDLSKAENVTVGANGSIGGGYGVGGNGGNLTVAGLSFAEATSKLVVTPVSSTDGTPGLVDVKISKTTDQGPVSAAKGFTVEVNGTAIVSGYVLKCTNGVSDKLSLPTVVNNSGKALCFKWDTTGLWMQTSFGNITLASSSVCPKGLNPGNLAITVTATYTDSRDYPSPGTAVDFSLSDISVKSSGNLVPVRGLNNLTMTTTFDGVNQTAADKPYTITYNDHQNCPVTLAATINPQPVLSINSGGNPACKGIPIVLQAIGTGRLTIFSANTDIATVVNDTLLTRLATASTLAAGEVNFWVTDTNGCKSEYLSVSVKDLPSITPANSTICGATSISLKADHDPATASAWLIEPATTDASIEDKNLLDREANFVANTLTEQKSIMVQYTDRLGCRGTTTLTVKPNPVISANGIALSQLCSGVSYSDALSGGEGSWYVYKTGTTEAGLSSVSASTTLGRATLQAGRVTVATAEDVVFTSTTTSCKSNVLTINISPNPVISANGIDVSHLCSGVSYANALSGGEGSWYVYKTGTTEVGLSKVTASTTQGSNLQAGTVSVLTVEDLVLTSNTASCKSKVTLTINPGPLISVNAIDVSHLCSGASYANALVGEGSWAVYKTGTAEASLSSVSASTTLGRATLQAGTVTAVTLEDVVLTSNVVSCKSKLTLTIYPKPVMNLIPNLTTCSNIQVPAYTPVSPAGVPEEAKTTQYKWKAEAVNPTDVGLLDYTLDWSKTAIGGFTATNTTGVLKREVTVSAYNSTSGCQAEPQVYTITVNPELAVTYTAVSPICSGTKTNISLRSTLSPTTYTWTVGNNSVGAQSQTASSSPANDVFLIRQTLTNKGSSSETVTYQVTGTSGYCSDTISIAVKVSNTALVKPTVESEDGWHHCVASEHGTYQTHLIPSVPGTNNVEWTYTSYYGKGQAATTLTGNTQKTERGTLTAVNDTLVLSHTSPASVYYVFRPYSAGCFGTPSDPIGVRLYAAPVVAAIPAQEVCSSSEAYPATTTIALSSSTPDVVYTWTVDRMNGRDVTGYSEPSGEGARVPTQNPSQARSGLISDALSLPANAGTQTLDYWITPWLFGCPGQAVLGRVKVNPPPAITAPADREHCLGNGDLKAAAEPLKGTATVFTWTGGVKAGLADQTVYGPGLPAYRVAATTTSVAVKVTISGKNDKGCKASTSFHIAMNPKPSITLGNPQILCAGPTIETAAQTNIGVSSPIAGTKYKWTATFVDFRPDGKSEVKLVNGNNELLALPVRESPQEEGNFIRKIIATTDSYAQVTFRLTPFLGNCAGEGKDTDVIVKGVNLLTGAANNSPDVCSGGTTHIKIGKEGDGNTYSWEGINNSGNVLGYTPSQESRATTISDVLTLTDGNNKPKRDSIIYRITPKRRLTGRDGNEYYCSGKPVSSTVFVNPIPVLSLSPATATICSGESTAISYSINLEQPESNDVYYSWEVTPNRVGARSSSGFQATIPQQVLTSDNASESSVTYTITPQYQPASGGTCKGQPVTSTYQVSSRARANINNIPEAVCLGDKVTLKTNSKGVNFQWLKNGKTIPGATGDSYLVPTDSVSVSSYAVAITTSGCGNSTSEARKVQVSADAYFTGGSAAMDKVAAAMGEVVKFSYTGPKADYLWDFNDQTPMPNTESVTHSYTKLGTYYPTLKASKPGQAACTKTFSFSLEIRSANPTIVVGYGVFPIPARDKLTISSSEDDLQNITLSDMSGKMVLNEAVKGRNVSLSVAYIAQGVYLLTITNTTGEVRRLEIAKE